MARPPSEGAGTRTARLLSEYPKPYKSLKHVDKVLGKTAHRSIKAVRLQKSTVTNDPKVVLEEVLSSFQSQHNTEDKELSAYTEELISHLPKLYNHTQRRDMHHTPFTIRELDEVLYKLKPGKTPGGTWPHGRTLPQALAEPKEWDIAIKKTDVPPDWANLVHPLYRKNDFAMPTLPCDKRPQRAASTKDTSANKTMPPRISICDPWLPPYGATNAHYIQRYTPMTCRPSLTPRTLPHGWTPHAGNSGSGTSAKRRSWHKNSNATFSTPQALQVLKARG